jgi:hypothetical protein
MLRMLRREDRRRMVDRVDITRGTWPDVETVAANVGTVIRPSQRITEEIPSGGTQVIMHAYDLRLPVNVEVERGDVITVVRSHDDRLVGRWLTVFEVVADTEQTSRIVVCKESR